MLYNLLFFTAATVSLSFALRASATPVPINVPENVASNVTMSSLSRRVDHYGQGTYFFPGLGNCGDWNNENDMIVAISTQIYHGGANCNQWMEITNTQTNQRTYGLVKDSCPSCSPGSVDMSPAVFQQLAPLEVGLISIEWHYMPRGFSP